MKFEEMINTIQLGDCYEIINDIPDKSIDLIITDPPYEWQRGGKNTGLFRKGVSSPLFMNQIEDKKIDKGINYDILDEFVRILKRINIYIWCNKDQFYKYMEYFVGKKNCYFEIIIWNKTNVTPLCGNKYLTDKEYCLFFREKGVPIMGTYDTKKTVYTTSSNREDKENYTHPTIKPLHIIKNLIENSSNKDDIILDCFCGSGTTCVGAKQLGRKFIGIEIDSEYYKIAINRLNGILANGQMTFIFENNGNVYNELY